MYYYLNRVLSFGYTQYTCVMGVLGLYAVVCVRDDGRIDTGAVVWVVGCAMMDV